MQSNAAPITTHTIPRLSSLLPPHFSRLTSRKGTARRATTAFKDSGSIQTSSFRAQSRNPCFPALQHRCCDYAQHDGMCRAPLPPSPTPFPVFPHSSLLISHASLLARARHAVPLQPSKTAAVSKLRHSARSRGIHVSLHSNIDAATTRSMTACAGHRCPHHPHHSPSFLTPHSSLLTPHSSLLTPHPSPLTPHPSPLTPHPSPLTPHPSLLTPHPSPLTPHSSLLTPHSSPLTPHPSPLTPHSSLLTPHSSLLTPHSSLLRPHSSPLTRTVGLTLEPSSATLKTEHSAMPQQQWPLQIPSDHAATKRNFL